MTDREISLPFRLDGQGRVAAVSDPNKIGRQHLTSYLLTRPGERLMRPDFGTPIKDYLFETLDPINVALLTQRVQEKVGRDVRNLRLIGIEANSDYDQAVLELTVEFALAVGAGQDSTQTTTLSLGGTA